MPRLIALVLIILVAVVGIGILLKHLIRAATPSEHPRRAHPDEPRNERQLLFAAAAALVASIILVFID